MAKFALECPHCGTVNKASTFILGKKVITCGNCKNEINVKEHRMAIGNCVTCGSVAFDQAKGTCPICKKKINVQGADSVAELQKSGGKTPLFLCSECGCDIQPVEKNGGVFCPVCDRQFNGYEEIYSIIKKEKIVTDTGISVIKYEGANDTFVWKHPIEDFNMGTQLIVHESQEAIFFLNGQALDTFGPGRYTLETENLPVLRKVQTLPTGKQNPFHAEVYFINKTVQMGIKWGTDSRVNFIEPETGIPLDIGASGEMNIRVADSRKLLIKLVGTTNGIAWNESAKFKQSLQAAFRPLIQTTVKSHLANVIKEEKINILEIDNKLEQLSASLGAKVSEGFNEYGLDVAQFFVNRMSLPEDNKNFQKIRDLLGAAYLGVKEAEVEAEITKAQRQQKLEQEITELELEKIRAEKTVIGAQAEAAAEKAKGFAEAEVMHAMGYDQKDVLQAEVQKAYAAGIGQMGSGDGSGGGNGMMSEILGLGVGMAAMGTMGEKVGDAMRGFAGASSAVSPANTENTWACSCGCSTNTGKFCSECGAAKPESWDCLACGAKGNKGKFCSECGAAKPEAWDCVHCGAKGNKGKFCSECGKTNGTVQTWDCECGNKGITGKFCSECGKKREENE